LRSAVLPGLHALSGSDNTDKFYGKSKTSFWKVFMKSKDDVLLALASLGTSLDVSKASLITLEKFICDTYLLLPNSDLVQLRWHFFTKKMQWLKNYHQY